MTMESLSTEQFKTKAASGSVILDSRNSLEFVKGFIPGSIYVGSQQGQAPWVPLLPAKQKSFILVAEPGHEKAFEEQLKKSGIVLEGFLQGGFEAWQRASEKFDLIIDIEADEFSMDLAFDDAITVLDVREEAEFLKEHVKDAVNIPLNELGDVAQIASLEEDEMIYIHSNHEYRSVIAASLLKRQGYHLLRIITGGFASIRQQKNIPLEKDTASFN